MTIMQKRILFTILIVGTAVWIFSLVHSSLIGFIGVLIMCVVLISYVVSLRLHAMSPVASSEFGAGVVVPLVKFSEHLWDGPAYSEALLRTYADWQQLTPVKKIGIEEEAKRYPHGDAARRIASVRVIQISEKAHGSPEGAISAGISLWMNGASDHFYDLDRKRAPKPLIDLADLCLTMGHGFTDRVWTMDDVEHVRELWQAAALAVDRKLTPKPDWGEW